MITVKLKGGMGNQMFQYALGRVLSIKNKTDLKLDISFFDLKLSNITKRNYDLDVFNIKAEVVKKNSITTYISFLLRKIIRVSGKEKNFSFDAEILSLGSNTCLEGYWHSPKYFAGFEDVIRKDFTPKNPLAQNIHHLMKEVENQNSVCIHVRRGDYVGNKYHEVVSNEYYERGIKYISGKTVIEKIYVFSDDINWCRENLAFKTPAVFVGGEYVGIKGEGHMFLMSKCKSFIIANSTFSWWAAWLSNYPDKIVVCPKQWFGDASRATSDLIPDSWIQI
jgi:hypothetical protein